MSLTNVFHIAGSGMSAQSTRLNTVASNIANAETVSSSLEQTYRARKPVFATVLQEQMNPAGQSLFAEQGTAGYGVREAGIVEDQAELQARYEPDHPPADANAYAYAPHLQAGRG